MARLLKDRLHTQSAVSHVGLDGTVSLGDERVCRAAHVVLALPPQLVTHSQLVSELPVHVAQDLAAIPTWMAGHAKFVALYDRPCWLVAGLSGDATSRHGPLMEIHDASGPDGSPAALFVFLGILAVHRRGTEVETKLAAKAQLTRLFGPEARHHKACALCDWARQPHTATQADLVPPSGHPAYGVPTSV